LATKSSLSWTCHKIKLLKKEEIINQLSQNHQLFIDYITALNEESFLFSANNKWTAGQQLDHIYLAVKPITQAFLLPNFILSILFSTSNRPSKTYEALVEKYLDKLAKGGRATGRFVPKPIAYTQKDRLAKKLLKTINKLCSQVSQYSENELDTLLLPHPLLGKLTLREMMYFTIYHLEHHHGITIKNLVTKAG
jgi:hypothetical protein